MKVIQRNMKERERDTDQPNSKQENKSLTSQDKMKNRGAMSIAWMWSASEKSGNF